MKCKCHVTAGKQSTEGVLLQTFAWDVEKRVAVVATAVLGWLMPIKKLSEMTCVYAVQASKEIIIADYKEPDSPTGVSTWPAGLPTGLMWKHLPVGELNVCKWEPYLLLHLACSSTGCMFNLSAEMFLVCFFKWFTIRIELLMVFANKVQLLLLFTRLLPKFYKYFRIQISQNLLNIFFPV